MGPNPGAPDINDYYTTPSRKSVFVVASSNSNRVSNARFYSTHKRARKALAKKLEDCRHRIGVDVTEVTEDSFTYIMGWEERKTQFSIVEIPLDVDVD